MPMYKFARKIPTAAKSKMKANSLDCSCSSRGWSFKGTELTCQHVLLLLVLLALVVVARDVRGGDRLLL